MKKLIIFCVLVWASCSDEPNSRLNEELTSIPEDLGGINLGGFVAPPGTKAVLSNDGRVLTYTLPEGFLYVGLNKDGSVEALSGGCYQCTSTCSRGCDVIRLGDQIGCSACDPGSSGGKECTGSHCDVHQMLEQGGIVNINLGIRLLENGEDIRGLRNDLPSWKILERLDVVQNELNRFFAETWGDHIDIESGRWVLVNFFGAAAKMLIPANYTAARTVSAQGTTCNCTSGSGCTYEAIYRMGIKVGEICRSGGCNNCQMIYQ